VNDETCPTCGNPLLIDRRTVAEFARLGYEGGRIFCRLGCGPDIWIKRRIERPVPEGLEIDSRGKYEREWRTYACQACGRPARTRGNNARWCPECKAARRAGRGTHHGVSAA